MQIVSGELAPGSLITSAVLAERFAASRTVLREAIRVLESKGLVRPWPKTGTRVLDQTAWDFLDRDVIRWRMRGPDRARQLSELMDLRGAVETAAARACCSHATPAEVAALDDCAQELRSRGAAGDLRGFTEADIRFHALLLTASHNLVFGQFAEPFGATLLAREELATLPEHIHHDTLEDHLEVAAAVAARDPDRAQAALERIIAESRTEALERLQR